MHVLVSRSSQEKLEGNPHKKNENMLNSMQAGTEELNQTAWSCEVIINIRISQCWGVFFTTVIILNNNEGLGCASQNHL